MKVLAIRGKNLASLSSEFEVNFQAEPLASAGLFAITGPTGAGKSTLLDALCLALYDLTPRLNKAVSRNSEVPDTGGLSIAQHDPRTTLRRGAAEGFAEVDFVGNDGVSYRARWTVRRARNKADGKLQNSEISLEGLADHQPLGDRRKTETLKLIESKIGLTFDQFTRAVLLAQNDFATFLKASDDERAELLQTLTGTETFADISKLAFGRMREEKENLQRLEEQRNTLAPLAPDVRTEKDAKLKAQNEQIAALEKAKGETESWLRWFETLAKSRAVEAEAGKQLEQAKASQASAQARYQTLASIEQVQPVRPLLEEQTRLSHEIAVTTKTVGERKNEVARAVKDLAARASELETAGKLVAQAEAEKTKAAPLIDTAKSLDAKLAALTPTYEQAVKTRENADKAHRESVQKHESAKHELRATEIALTTAERWLSEHQEQKALAEGWQGWDAIFEQALSQATDKNTLERDIAGFNKRAGELADAFTKANGECGKRSKEHEVMEKELASLTTAWKTFDADAMAKRKHQQEERREQLIQGQATWSEWVKLQQRFAQVEEQKKPHVATADTNAKLLEGLVQQRPRLEQERDAATRAYELAQLAAGKDAKSLRASLQTDQPCPVCGALEHPYAQAHSSPADAMLKALQDNRDECQKALTSLLEVTATKTAEQKHAQDQVSAFNKELTELGRNKAENQSRWSALPIANEVMAVSDEARLGWFAEQQSQLKASLEALKQKEDGYREATKHKDDAQTVLNQHRLALETAQKSLNELEAEQKASQQARELALQRLLEFAKQIEATLDKLDGAFVDSGWRTGWASNPEQFIEKCRRDVETWLHQQKQSTDLTVQTRTQKITEAALADARVKTETALKVAVEQFQQQETALKAIREQRQSIFDGKPVKEVEERLEHACADAKSRQTKAQNDHQKVNVERTRLDEALRHVNELLVKHQGAQSIASKKFEDWLKDFNANAGDNVLSIDALLELLTFDAAWITQERKTLQTIDQAVEGATAVAKAHRETRYAHEKTKPTELGEEVLKESLAKIRADITAVGEVSATLRAEILADDERQKQAKGLLETIKAQEKKTYLWSQLGELIGSADGKKFRNFAQQLTLDILLGYGNRHLETLSRRYQLERIKDSLGLLVIDQDMGDEVRSVHSLSGGESFLLSLALALGLASLSSHRVRVESLFIDEGFGSLDSDSLRVAMDALDTLQAQGRKVGVISHVQEMNERIGVRIQVQRQSGGQSRVTVI